MARQRPTRIPTPHVWPRGAPGLVMGPCIVEINRIVIREVQYQIEVNRCINEEIIVKGNFGWTWPMWAGRPRIDCIVIRKVQYQFEVNRCRNKEIIEKGNFGWAWPMWARRPRINRIVIREVQYQFEVNRCRNKEIIVKGNFGLALPMWAGRPRIDRIVIREVQYQFEDNRCRNEEIIEIGARTDRRTDGEDNHNTPTLFKKRGDKDNLGWVWPIMGGAPQVEIDRIVIRDVQYQFEVNRCRIDEIIMKGNFGWAWSMWAWPMGRAEIDRIVIREVQYQFEVNRCRNEEIIVKGNFGWAVGNRAMHKAQYQFEVNRCRNEEVNFQGSTGGQDGQTDGQAHITTISPLFLRKTWG
ncbi:hypothetical protein DPMN_055871 [Dreissena polymorpha]|uniref:Uncharacterized protein n=1 Tax=Dreissena polymorpha TaxID=45954 RepID=A0A9D4CT86_DREPO|nr:hypothetical protein DPMN_055871 [Dreissena polymorpha]